MKSDGFVDLRNGLLHGWRERRGTHSCADQHVGENGFARHLRIRKVSNRRKILTQRLVFHIANNPYNLDGLRERGLRSKSPDSFAQRIRAREEFLGKCLIDDEYAGNGPGVALVEVAAFQQRRAQSGEVAGRNVVNVRFGVFPCRCVAVVHYDLVVLSSRSDRCDHRLAYAYDPGDGANAAQHLIAHRVERSIRNIGIVEINIDHQYIAAVKACVKRHQIPETPHEQSRGDHQHERNCHLRRHGPAPGAKPRVSRPIFRRASLHRAGK